MLARRLLPNLACLPSQGSLGAGRASQRSLGTDVTSPVVTSTLPPVHIPHTQLTPLLMDRASRWEDSVALEDAETGEAMRYGELAGRVEALARALTARGLGQGAVVAVLLPNCVQYPVVVLGAAAAQCTVSPINSAYTAEEMRGLVEDSGAQLVVTDPGTLARATAACTGLGVSFVVTGPGTDGVPGLDQLVTEGQALTVQPEAGDPSSVLLLPFSSGTTGRPKGVELSHTNYVANIVQMEPLELGMEGKAQVQVMPMFHAGGMKSMMETLYHGGTVVSLATFHPTTYLDSLLRHRPCHLVMAPPLVQFLSKSKDATPDHFASLEKVFVGAAPVGESLILDFLRKAPQAEFREAWGMTELSAIGTFTTADIVTGSCGKVLPNSSLRVADLETGAGLGPGHRGEVCIRGPQVMLGYRGREEETRQTIKDGWLHTGDIGYYDEGGNLFLVDRLKELIKVKGFQVAPAELEDVIRSIPEATDVAVIGVASQRHGEVPRAYVVRSSPSLREEDVARHVAGRLSDYKHLAGGVQFVDSIPKSAAGKILKKELREDYRQSQARGPAVP